VSQLTVPELGVLAAADQHRLSVDELAKALGAQLKEVEGSEHKNENIVTAWHEKLKGKTDYPLGATLVVTDTGEQVPLRPMVGQADSSRDDRPEWVVYDITSERSHDSYDGTANTHKDALLAALRTFAGENPYGYGYIGLAWPPSFGALVPDTRGLPTVLRSAPDAKKRKEHRHSAYVDIATFLLPVAKAAQALELVKAAEIFITLLGTVNAVDALKDRARRGHLYEPSTLLELAQIADTVKLTGKAVHYVSTAGGLVRAARVAGTSLQLLTVLELSVQVISIPPIVREQVKAIDSMTIGSAEHKAAMLGRRWAPEAHDPRTRVTEPRQGPQRPTGLPHLRGPAQTRHSHQAREHHGDGAGGSQPRSPHDGLPQDPRRAAWLFGKGEGLKFRLDLAQKQQWEAWDVLFDSLYGPAGGLNTPSSWERSCRTTSTSRCGTRREPRILRATRRRRHTPGPNRLPPGRDPTPTSVPTVCGSAASRWLASAMNDLAVVSASPSAWCGGSAGSPSSSATRASDSHPCVSSPRPCNQRRPSTSVSAASGRRTRRRANKGRRKLRSTAAV
jgi:hypothetical protein